MGLGCFNGNRNSRMLLQDLHSTCTPSTCDSSNVSIEFTLRGGKCRRTAAARAVTNVTDWGHLVQWRFFTNYLVRCMTMQVWTPFQTFMTASLTASGFQR